MRIHHFSRLWESTCRASVLLSRLWSCSQQTRCMAFSPWGDDSRVTKRWGYTDSQWRKLHRRLRLHGVRLPKKWILDPNKNFNMKANIDLMRTYGMTDHQQRMALMEGVFLFTKERTLVEQNYEFIKWRFKVTSERMNEIMTTHPVVLDLKYETKIGPFYDRVLKLGYTKHDVQQLVLKHPLVLTYPTRMIKNITKRYVDLGLTCAQIVEMASKAHYMLDTAFDTKIEKLLRWFEQFLKVKMIYLAPHPEVFLATIARLKESFWWLHDSAGFKKEEIKLMTQRCPMILAQKYIHLRIKLSFAIDCLGKQKRDVELYPYFLVWPFAQLSSRVAYMDYKGLNAKAHPLDIIFCEFDKYFVEKIKGLNLDEYIRFQEWWMSLPDVGKLDALQYSKYQLPASSVNSQITVNQEQYC